MIDTEPLRLRLDPENEPDFRASLRDSVAELPTEQELAALRLALAAHLGEPERLQREPNSSLGAALSRWDAELPSAAELRRLRARLPLERGAPQPSRPRRRAWPRVAAVAAWLLPFAAAAAAAGYFLRDRPKTEPALTPAHEPALAPPPSVEPAPSASSAPTPTLAPSSAPPPTLAPSSARADSSAAAPRPQSAKPSELELMHDAKAALGSDPNHALALLNQLAKLYPSGVLAQEREVLAIDALSRLGRKGEANARATRFSNSYPASAHWPHIQRLLSNAGP